MTVRQSDMVRVGIESIVCYWLVPAEPMRRFSVSTIEALAARFDAPVFEPHVTIYVTRNGAADPVKVLGSVLANSQPYRLSVRDIQSSEQFTKTLFVQFESTPSLVQLRQALQHASGSQDAYDLNPHLSLLYKEMAHQVKLGLTASIHIPFTEVLFDLAKAVVCPQPIKSRDDVECWRVSAEQKLIA